MYRIEQFDENHLVITKNNQTENVLYSDMKYCKYIGGYSISPGIKIKTNAKNIIVRYKVDKKIKNTAGYTAIRAEFSMFSNLKNQERILKQTPAFKNLKELESHNVPVKKQLIQVFDIEAANLPIWRRFFFVMLNSIEILATFLVPIRLAALLSQENSLKENTSELIILCSLIIYLCIRYVTYFKTGYSDKWQLVRLTIPSWILAIVFPVFFLSAITLSIVR